MGRATGLRQPRLAPGIRPLPTAVVMEALSRPRRDEHDSAIGSRTLTGRPHLPETVDLRLARGLTPRAPVAGLDPLQPGLPTGRAIADEAQAGSARDLNSRQG